MDATIIAIILLLLIIDGKNRYLQDRIDDLESDDSDCSDGYYPY